MKIFAFFLLIFFPFNFFFFSSCDNDTSWALLAYRRKISKSKYKLSAVWKMFMGTFQSINHFLMFSLRYASSDQLYAYFNTYYSVNIPNNCYYFSPREVSITPKFKLIYWLWNCLLLWAPWAAQQTLWAPWSTWQALQSWWNTQHIQSTASSLRILKVVSSYWQSLQILSSVLDIINSGKS